MKNIEDLYYPSDIRNEIKGQNQEFSLNDFYLDNSGEFKIKSYGLYIITPSQDFYCYAHKNHGEVIENILFSIHDDYNDVFTMNNYEWLATSIYYGHITMQLMSKHYSVIWFPKVINRFQYDRLVQFYEKIKEINKQLVLKGNSSISFRCGYYGDEFLDLTLDEAIIFMKDKISDSVRSKEIIIGQDESKKKN